MKTIEGKITRVIINGEAYPWFDNDIDLYAARNEYWSSQRAREVPFGLDGLLLLVTNALSGEFVEE